MAAIVRVNELFSMTDRPRFDIILLDDGWRPADRLCGETEWTAAVRHMLAADGRWIALEQRRSGALPAIPCPRDIALTRALHRRLRPLEIGLADHVIHADDGRFSFRDAGLL